MTFMGKENEVKEPEVPTPLRTYTYNRWGGQKCTVEAHFVNFTSGHVNFWIRRADDEQDTLVLSEVNTQVTTLKEVTS